MSRPTSDDLKAWVKACLEEGMGLTPWEETFVNDLDERLRRFGTLSERQAEILERIYSEKTP